MTPSYFHLIQECKILESFSRTNLQLTRPRKLTFASSQRKKKKRNVKSEITVHRLQIKISAVTAYAKTETLPNSGFAIDRMLPAIIFVCTSNTCRSPMAEEFAGSWLIYRDLQSKYRVISRGLTDQYEPPNSPASAHGSKVLHDDFDLDLQNHRSAMLSSQDVKDAHIIIGVTKSHVRVINQKYPESTGKVHSLPVDVSDPWHASLDTYKLCAHQMRPLVYEALDSLIL